MKIAIPVYLVALVLALTAALWYLAVAAAPDWILKVRPVLVSVAMGGLGGASYCLRAVYLNLGVHKR